ncbi:hypothetical protein, partial [Aquamicrobium sp.]|uniref:hypothetical protein n=1 Tax=Aquamicrobium sp. TaxID=1872579 RepID=UPI00258DD973
MAFARVHPPVPETAKGGGAEGGRASGKQGAMRLPFIVLAMLLPAAAHAAPSGTWTCHYRNPNQKQQVRIVLSDG